MLLFLQQITGVTSLQHLNLSGCKGVTDSGIAHLGGRTALQHLDLNGCESVTDIGVAHLRSYGPLHAPL
jgi:hypothetical protein